jgi:hypothetical protein
VVLFHGYPEIIKWHDVFLVMFRLDLVELIMEPLNDHGADKCIVMHEHCRDNLSFYVSYDTNNQTATKIKRRANGDVGYTGFAQFTRYYALLTESYVELGLRKLRKSQDLELYLQAHRQAL